jgi:hypothetical protein
MVTHAATLAPGLVLHLARGGALVDRAIVRVLGHAGSGYEPAVAEQLRSRDEQTARAALRALARIGTARAAAFVSLEIQQGGPLARAAEEALWHFPLSQTTVQIGELLKQRDFVVHNPGTVSRIISRVSANDIGDLDNALEELEALRFRVWNPDLVRVAWKARGLRSR